MKTYMANAQTVERKWYVVDADGVPLGRLASKVAAASAVMDLRSGAFLSSVLESGGGSARQK